MKTKVEGGGCRYPNGTISINVSGDPDEIINLIEMLRDSKGDYYSKIPEWAKDPTVSGMGEFKGKVWNLQVYDKALSNRELKYLTSDKKPSLWDKLLIWLGL